MGLYPYLRVYTKIRSKCVTDLNISGETINFLKENMGENCGDIGLGKIFLYITPNTQYTEEQINKLDFMKIIKLLCFKRNY